MRKLEDLKKLIGNTPLIEIKYNHNGVDRLGYFKAEWFNLSGSIKDRVAYSIIENSYISGDLTPGQTIVETTSGNMGLSFCALGSYLGHKVVIFMPEFMSKERKDLTKLLGGELVFGSGFKELFKKAEIYAKENNAFLPHQFANKNNIGAHVDTTAREIDIQLNGDVNAVVAGVGTGGTLIGLAKYFKNKDANIKSFAIDPKQSSLLTFGHSIGKHRIQGLSDEIIPAIYDKNFVDEVIRVDDKDAIAMAQKLSKELGLPVGISGGANFVGSVLTGLDRTVSVFADDSKKYLSTDLAAPIRTELVDSIKLLSMKAIR